MPLQTSRWTRKPTRFEPMVNIWFANPPGCCLSPNVISFSEPVPAGLPRLTEPECAAGHYGPVEVTEAGSHNGSASPEFGTRNDWLLWQLADSAFPTGG